MYVCVCVCVCVFIVAQSVCKVFSIFMSAGQEQQDRNYAASIQYQRGDKCFVSVMRTNKHAKLELLLSWSSLKWQGATK